MDHDVVCIGNSRGVNSFLAPHINKNYDVTAYNLAYNGLKMGVMKSVLYDFLDRHEAPEVVFIEVSNVFNNVTETDYASFNLFASRSDRLNQGVKQTDKTLYNVSQAFPLFRYNSELFYRSLYYIGRPDQNWINRYSISDNLLREVRAMEPATLELNKEEVSELSDIVRILSEKDINVCLFVAPYLPDYLEKVTNLQENIAYVEAQTGKVVLDYSKLVTETAFFADRVHTNDGGARVLSERLMQEYPCD